jgi:NTE family protein
MITPPDVLVLGGGGVLGEMWMMGVLAGIEDATGFDLRECEYFVGTSAGSIVCTHLAAGESPRRPSFAQPDGDVDEAGSEPVQGLAAAARQAARWAGGWAAATGAAFAPLALGLTAPGGALARAAMLQRIPRPRQDLTRLRARVERSGVRFDGRLRVTAVDRRSGRRVVFGSPGAPTVGVGDAVSASCAVPWLFTPVTINGREYVDGGAWSPTNLDAAPAGRGTHVLCLNPTAGVGGAGSALTLVRTFSRSAMSVEAMALRRRGAAVRLTAPSAECSAAMGSNYMDPEPSDRVIAAAYRQGLRLAREPGSAPTAP